MTKMPRLAPQFQGKPAVIELRNTKGTYERDLEKRKIELTKIKTYSGAVNDILMPIGMTSIGLGLGLGGYFVARGMTALAQAWLGETIDNILDEGKKVFEGIRGKNKDGSYATVLCISGPREGQVIVNSGLGNNWLGIGGLSGAFFLWIASVRSTNSEDTWVPIYGNFNPNAKFIGGLSEGWLYLNDERGGSADVTDDYNYQSSDDSGNPPEGGGVEEFLRQSSIRYEDYYDTSGTYESAWAINGWTYEEWLEMGSPITQVFIDYMLLHPIRYPDYVVQYFINLMNYQETYWSEENQYPNPPEFGSGEIPEIDPSDYAE